MSDDAVAMEWRVCVGFPQYEISECGDVRRKTWSRTRSAGWRPRGHIDQDGYIQFLLLDVNGEKRKVSSHHLVAVAFLGSSPGPEFEVAHRNGSKIMNHYSNLRWSTRKSNHADMKIHGTSLKGERNNTAKLTDDQIYEIRREYQRIKDNRTGELISDLAKRFGIHHATLLDIAKGRTWTHLPSMSDRPFGAPLDATS